MKKMKWLVVIMVGLLSGCSLIEEPVVEDPDEVVEYKVDFLIEDSKVDERLKEQIVEEGDKVELFVPQKDGHTFKGWFLDEDNYHYEFLPNQAVTSDLTLYPYFEPETYTVTFNRMDGNYQAPHDYHYGETLDGLSIPKRIGYTFDGWYRSPEFTEEVTVGLPINNDLTLYAKWVEDLRYNEDILYFEDAITTMLERVRTSVVGIRNISLDGEDSTGSGVIYKNEGNEYYVVTNHHVLRNHENVEIVYEKNGLLFEIPSSDITYLGSDSVTDVGVIRFTSTETFYTVRFANTYDLKLGQFVYAIGSPLGFQYYNSVTSGVVSGLTRFMETGELNTATIQHDAAISPGNSGGALFNTQGELMGINTLKIVRSDVEGLGFAVPANTIARIIADIEETGEVTRPFLGVSANPLVSTCNQDYGVCIADVIEDSSAFVLGLQENDVIIGYKTETMDTYLTIQNFNQLREAILNSRVGELVSVRIIRNGEYIETDYEALVEHPDDLVIE